MEKRYVVCDTNILIEFYKGNPDIISNLHKIQKEYIALSVVTAAELIYGAINKKELRIIEKDIQSLKVLPITERISSHFMNLMLKYSLSHNLDLPDALIASTAIVNGLELYTLNLKHFKYIDSLKIWSC